MVVETVINSCKRLAAGNTGVSHHQLDLSLEHRLQLLSPWNEQHWDWSLEFAKDILKWLHTKLPKQRVAANQYERNLEVPCGNAAGTQVQWPGRFTNLYPYPDGKFDVQIA